MSLTTEGLHEQEAFLQEWPLSRLEALTLEEYTNLDRSTSFTYWLEKKTEHSGSIWGGSAFKFGIYRRADTQKVQDYDNRLTDGVYAWFKKYGDTAEEAFKHVKEIVMGIATASQSGVFEFIDNVDLGESVKWKIAFHYNANSLVPIFKREVLVRAAEKGGLAEARKRPISKLQEFLINQKQPDENTIEYSFRLWNKFNIENIYSTLNKFLEQAQTTNQKKIGYPKVYQNLDVKLSFGMGGVARIPWIGFLQKPNTVTDGIYPVFLFYKEVNILILAYGVSETNTSIKQWNNASSLETIEDWYLKTYGIKPFRYGNSYVKSIYNVDDEMDADLIQKDLDDLIEEYKLQVDGSTGTDAGEIVTNPIKYWILAPGEQARKWDSFYDEGIVGLGWDKIDDLSKFNERDAITQQLQDEYPEGSKTQTNNSLALWQFSREMKPGDIVIAKRGTSLYLGYGIVISDYYYDPSNLEFKHLRRVDWKKKGKWEESTGTIVTKTLTNITQYSEYVDRLKRLIGIEQDAELPEKVQYWWLNFSPKYWDLHDLQIGQTITYKTFNAKGIKRNNYQCFEQAKPGDLVIGFETSPVNRAVGVFEVMQGLHLNDDDGDEEISLLLQRLLPDTHTRDTLKQVLKGPNSSQLPTVSIHALEKGDFEGIINFEVALEKLPYTMEEALKELFMEEEDLVEVVNRLRYKKNIILQGPPGTGKTFMAKRIAYLLLEEKDSNKVETVQFHQSYAYEDFIQGYKPTDNGSFKLLNGVFYRFCKKATADPGNNYFFIIDEINRGNLSKVFGELMLLIEADKRGPDNAVSLTYGSANDEKFFIPDNLFVIGTMNTADRSLAVVDYALRRRFAFVDVNPSFDQSFKNELLNNGVDEGITGKIVERMRYLNKQITDDQTLGRGFQIGHSYFCNFTEGSGDENWYKFIMKYEIGPLLAEYWFDSPDIVQKMIDHLEK